MNHTASHWMTVLCDQGCRGADVGDIVPTGLRDTTPGQARSHIMSPRHAPLAIGLKDFSKALRHGHIEPRRITDFVRPPSSSYSPKNGRPHDPCT